METQNFVIRETRFSDYEYFTKWECDENITKYMSFDENRSYEDVVTEALYSKKDPTKLDYTIVARENGKPVGRIYITRIDRNFDSLDITRFYIGESSLWGNGLGRENHARAAGVLLYLPAHGACDAGSLCRQQTRRGTV